MYQTVNPHRLWIACAGVGVDVAFLHIMGIGRRDVRCGEIPGHQALDGEDTQRRAGLEGTRKDISQVRRLG
jgi:hypothetical protein